MTFKKLPILPLTTGDMNSKTKQAKGEGLAYHADMGAALEHKVNNNNNNNRNNNNNNEKDLPMDEHRIPIEKLLTRYGTDPVRGLRDAQVESNRATFGSNILIPPKKASTFVKFMKEVFGGLNALLWGCCLLAFISFGAQFLEPGYKRMVTDSLILGIALIIVIFISAVFSFYQDFKSSRIMESFNKMVPRFAKVIRSGTTREINVGELVVGDIVDIRYGDLIPADIRILECSDFKVDNSSLTGESEPQKRSNICTHDDPMETRNLAFFSTNALEGYCKGLVVRVGSTTLMGRLAALASNVESGRTPIGKEMDHFILIMTIRSLVFGVLSFGLAMFLNYHILDAIFFVIGIVVANVPEGLCVTFTLILALTAKRMGKKNCLVKNLQAVETLGSTSVICTDKTGTLTQNKMSVAHLWFNSEVIEADTRLEVSWTGRAFDLDDPGFKALSTVAILCSRAVFKSGQEDVPIHNRQVDGDASETAILKSMETQVGGVVKMREKCPKLLEIPFNSSNKYQVSIHDMRDPKDSRYLLVMKGAPERVISYCTRILIKDQEYELDQTWKDEFNRVYSLMGSYGERVLGFCDCRLPSEQFPVGYEFDPEKPSFLNCQLRFVGLISMIDPPRATVPDAVAKCRTAGIKVVMVTGDHPITAVAIARAVGIFTPGHFTIEEIAKSRRCSIDDVDPTDASAAVITGAELKLLSKNELMDVLRIYNEIVFARTSPEQKYDIVEAFQKIGYIVASTGDGVNDSPAIKKADIGIAMGISGSEVSKETADMILMDDNFASIVTGIEEGRLIFDNLKKLLAYNLADNVAELYSVFAFILLRVPLPFGTIAMLLSVVGTDVAPAISIAHEKAEADIMKLRPRNPNKDKLITPQLMSYAYGQSSAFQLLAGFFCYFVTLGSHGFLPGKVIGNREQWDSTAINDLEDSYGQEWSYHGRKQLGLEAQTSFFVAIVVMQVANVFMCKTRRMSVFQQGFKNWNMNFSVVFELALLCLFVYTPYLNGYFLLVPTRPMIFLIAIPFALLFILYDELRRLAIRTWPDGWAKAEFYT